MNKGLVRSLDRRGTRSDKNPAVAQKQKFSDPSFSAFERFAWNAAWCALVAASLMLATPSHAASSIVSEAVCDVRADYALGVEDYPEAIRLHQNVLRHDPNDALAHYHLGYAYGMNHDRAGELREYRRAAELGLLQWDLFLNLGILYLENHNSSAAIDALRTAAKLGPRHPEAHFNLALAYQRAGLLMGAQKEILASLAFEPDQPDAQNTLAVIYAELGNNESARTVWMNLVRIDPDYQPARTNLDILERATTNGTPELRLSMIADSSQRPH